MPRFETIIISFPIFLLFVIPCLHGFAAKKNTGAGGGPKKRRAAASTNKGFGAAPPTFDEVVSRFRTRLPSSDATSVVDCPCGSGKTYQSCCEPFHKGERSCTAPTDVLRTRYSAFSYRLVKYVIDTTHPTCRDYQEDKIEWAKELNKNGMFDSYDFVDLEIGDEISSSEDEAFVDFRVRLRAKDSQGTLAGKETLISEKSRFLRNNEDGTWTYASGEVRSQEAGLEDSILN